MINFENFIKTSVKKERAFQTNPQKAQTKININSIMIGILFFILTVIIGSGVEKFNTYALAQLIIAIPLLHVSTLAYTKIANWKDTQLWEIFGWTIGNLGSVLLINSIGLVASNISQKLAYIYFFLFIVLMLLYSIINVIYSKKEEIKERVFKFLFFVAVIIFGGIIPLLGK